MDINSIIDIFPEVVEIVYYIKGVPSYSLSNVILERSVHIIKVGTTTKELKESKEIMHSIDLFDQQSRALLSNNTAKIPPNELFSVLDTSNQISEMYIVSKEHSLICYTVNLQSYLDTLKYLINKTYCLNERLTWL